MRRIRKRNRRPRIELEGGTYGVAVALVAAEVEQLVLDDCTPRSAAKLLEIARVLRLRARIEVVTGIERRVAANGVSRTVSLVVACLQTAVYDRPVLPAVFRGMILYLIDILDGVDWKYSVR